MTIFPFDQSIFNSSWSSPNDEELSDLVDWDTCDRNSITPCVDDDGELIFLVHKHIKIIKSFWKQY